MSRMDLCAIYAHAKPDRVAPVKETRIIRRATGESAFKVNAAKPAAKPDAAKVYSKPRFRVERVEDTK